MNANDRTLKGPDGIYGTVDTTCWPSLDEKTGTTVAVKLSDGGYVDLPADAVIEQNDGSFYVPLKKRELDAMPRASRTANDPHWPCPTRTS